MSPQDAGAALRAGAAELQLKIAFPDVDPEATPLGSRILIQLRQPKTVSKGGVIIPGTSMDTEKWNTQVGVIRAMGPVAFCSRDTLELWPEGSWCRVGDYVRIAKYGGDRFEVPLPGAVNTDDRALFVIVNDLELIAKVTGDPLKIIAFFA